MSLVCEQLLLIRIPTSLIYTSPSTIRRSKANVSATFRWWPISRNRDRGEHLRATANTIQIPLIKWKQEFLSCTHTYIYLLGNYSFWMLLGSFCAQYEDSNYLFLIQHNFATRLKTAIESGDCYSMEATEWNTLNAWWIFASVHMTNQCGHGGVIKLHHDVWNVNGIHEKKVQKLIFWIRSGPQGKLKFGFIWVTHSNVIFGGQWSMNGYKNRSFLVIFHQLRADNHLLSYLVNT